MNTLSIQEIHTEIRRLSDLRDPELLHPAADRLPVQLARQLASDRSDKQEIEQILAVWEPLPK